MGDQASERFEKKWQMSAIEFHWEAHTKQCALEDKVRCCAGCLAGHQRRQEAGGCCWWVLLSHEPPPSAYPSDPAPTRLPAFPVPQQLELESKSLPDKLQEVTAELQELTKKVRAGLCWRQLAAACVLCGR